MNRVQELIKKCMCKSKLTKLKTINKNMIIDQWKRLKNNLSISHKLYFGSFATISFFIIALAFTFIKYHEIDQINQQIQEQANYTIEILHIQNQVNQELASLKEWCLTGNDQALTKTKAAESEGLKLEKKLLEQTNDENQKERLLKVTKYAKLLSSLWQIKLEPMVKEKNYQVAYKSVETEDILYFNNLLRETDLIVSENKKEMNDLEEKEKQETQIAITVVLLLILMATFLGIACSLFISREINRPLKEVISGARRIAKGNLSEKITVYTNDEMGLLAKVFNEMLAQLNEIILSLHKSSSYLSQDSNILLNSSKSVADNVNRINYVMSGLSENTKQNVQNARQAMQASFDTQQAVDIGNQSVTMAIEKMSQIKIHYINTVKLAKNLNKQAQEIKQMLDIVKTIADQTNLLSLNASIEAARAGEYGRGFAVVAKEVGQLANNSRESVKQITQVIANIQNNSREVMQVVSLGAEEAATGLEFIQSTGETLQNIVGSVQTNALFVTEISKTAQEVNDHFERVTLATQKVTDSMNEVTATSQLLQGMAEKLTNKVNHFQIAALPAVDDH